MASPLPTEKRQAAAAELMTLWSSDRTDTTPLTKADVDILIDSVDTDLVTVENSWEPGGFINLILEKAGTQAANAAGFANNESLAELRRACEVLARIRREHFNV
jgi:hypothetical protein